MLEKLQQMLSDAEQLKINSEKYIDGWKKPGGYI